MAIEKNLSIELDGETYVFLGSQWRNIRTGRIASSRISMELESLAIKGEHVYGENVFSDLLNRAIERGLMPERGKIATEWLLERNKQTRDFSRKESFRMNKSGANLRSELFSDSNLKRVSSPEIGKMYVYIYNSKLYEEGRLKYYDAFPCMFCIEKYAGKSKGHLGLNLHYLPYQWRAKLMDALYKIKSTRYMNESTKLNVSYSILKSSSKFKGFEPTIHRYLAESKYTKSSYLEIPPNMWSFAMFLPLQRFIGANTQRVWSDSLKKIQ